MPDSSLPPGLRSCCGRRNEVAGPLSMSLARMARLGALIPLLFGIVMAGAARDAHAQGPVQGLPRLSEPVALKSAPTKPAAGAAESGATTETVPAADFVGPWTTQQVALAQAAVSTAATVPESAPAATPPAAERWVPAPAEVDAVWGPHALLPEGDPGSPRFIGPPLVPPLSILGVEVPSGSKQQLRWVAGQGLGGGDSVAPVHVVHGSRPGPVLCLAAAIHGDEINGVEIVRRVINEADAGRLSGTLVGVPIVNLHGFARGSRYLPDRRDLNRFFPGSARGSIASRMAYSFFQNVIRHCEALVDFHTGSFDRSNLPQIRADLRLPDVLRFARGFGEMPVLHSDGSRGMLRVAATAAGIPAVTFEVGAPGVLERAEIEAAHAALDALMHGMGMTPDVPLEQDPQPFFYNSRWIRADSGGLLLSDVELGQRVLQGQRLGVVVDPIENVERAVLAPFVGQVIGMARNQVVLPGFAVFHLGRETSAEAASDAAATTKAEPEMEEDPDPEPRDPDY